MNKMFAVLVLAWSGLAQAATPKAVVLDVQNMTCPTCNITIEKALGKTPGVTKTQVDLKSATVTVNFDADRTSAPAIAQVVTEAGFPAKARTSGK
ncbi:MAG: heavy-metal-associated domain-containing protein [Bacteroidetes bacterium]|nr:heavy-metal-associated domain-containing protein [Bacteroidota bacterium]